MLETNKGALIDVNGLASIFVTIYDYFYYFNYLFLLALKQTWRVHKSHFCVLSIFRNCIWAIK